MGIYCDGLLAVTLTSLVSCVDELLVVVLRVIAFGRAGAHCHGHCFGRPVPNVTGGVTANKIKIVIAKIIII